MLSDFNVWLFISYAVGTVFGLYVSKSKFNIDVHKIIEATIDRLITDKYIKARKLNNGEVELIRHDEK